MKPYPHSDLSLSRRLERCEGRANPALVEARARLDPGVGATWIECAGAYALFDGIASPLTQTFALGLFQQPEAADLDRIEHFFTERGSAASHEVSPLAGIPTSDALTGRGYRPIELTTVLYRPLTEVPAEGSVATRIAGPDETESWAGVAAEGWRELVDGDLMRSLARVSASATGVKSFFAELDGRAVATGALAIHEGVALLAGASTVPEARGRGAQGALLAARLRHAANEGCDLAMMCAAPGSASQRNAERHGFRVAYTRTKWGR